MDRRVRRKLIILEYDNVNTYGNHYQKVMDTMKMTDQITDYAHIFSSILKKDIFYNIKIVIKLMVMKPNDII